MSGGFWLFSALSALAASGLGAGKHSRATTRTAREAAMQRARAKSKAASKARVQQRKAAKGKK